MQRNLTEVFQQQIHQAIETKQALRIVGSDSKQFLGLAGDGRPLTASDHRGIIEYEPSELVIRVRAGTPLKEIQQTLTAHKQKLAFEPPTFGPGATLGGTIACNLSGPARPYQGAARDHVLGARIINGKGEVVRFGGEVIKNVAGYDASRLMCGAFGTLGLLLDVSLKVVPQEECQLTLTQSMDVKHALFSMTQLGRSSLPINALTHYHGQLYIRLAGNEHGVNSARQQLGGERLPESENFWQQLNEQQLDFFRKGDKPLWRLSLPFNQPELKLEGDWLLDWGGAQRWLRCSAPAEQIRQVAAQHGGHATLWRQTDNLSISPFSPLTNTMMALHQRLKQAFDPAGIFNPSRLYSEL